MIKKTFALKKMTFLKFNSAFKILECIVSLRVLIHSPTPYAIYYGSN